MKTKGLVVLFFLILNLSFCFSGLAQSQPDGSHLIKSKFFDIYIYPGVEIDRASEKIRINFYDELLALKTKYATEDESEKKLAHKLDLILQKVEKILDMYPQRMSLKLKIYPDQKQLDRAYYEIFNQANTPQRISFYIHKYETIYTHQEAVRQGVLAHELTHAVADHYFLILPSETVNEVLAQYVEMHLED